MLRWNVAIFCSGFKFVLRINWTTDVVDICKSIIVLLLLFVYYIKQVYSMLACVLLSNRRQNVVIRSMNHPAIASFASFLFLPHFDVICDQLLNRCTATWNQFVKLMTAIAVIANESAVKYSFVSKSMQTRRKGQYNAGFILSPRLCVKLLMTSITAIARGPSYCDS